jgi:RNA polymerase sigma factor (sigma-70 family)
MSDPAGDLHSVLIERALASDPRALRELVALVLPVVRARAVWALRRRANAERRGRDANQEGEDLTQDVLGSLFADKGRILRAWDSKRGLSLKNYVGLVAARQVSSILRTGRRSPWSEEPSPDSELAGMADSVPPIEISLAARELFDRLFERLHEELSVRGMVLFRALVVEEQSVEDVCRTFGMTEDSVYAWRSRLLRRTRELAAEIEPASTRDPSPRYGGGGTP